MKLNENNRSDNILNKGITDILCSLVQKRISTIVSVNEQGKKINIYDSDFSHLLHPNNNLSFNIGSHPFKLPEHIGENLKKIGEAFVQYYNICDTIYQSLGEEHPRRRILSHNRPKWLLELDTTNHLFIRPDFILTKDGMRATEIETSPFGLALSLFLNDAYEQKGALGMNIDSFLNYFIQEVLGNNKDKYLAFVLTEHTSKYFGQFTYLSKKLGEKGIDAIVAMSEDLTIDDGTCTLNGKKIDTVYRGFYLHESLDHDSLEDLLKSHTDIYPGCKSYLEEKSLMGLLYDPEFEIVFKEKLGDSYKLLQELFPQTYVLSNPPPGMLDIDLWEDLAAKPKSQRDYILKVSGFSDMGSWAKGVVFLNKLSKDKCRSVIRSAVESDDIFVVQKFHKGEKFLQEYYDFHEDSFKTMTGRVRFTPYFSVENGQLLTAKTTMCENTDYIHSSTSSINTPISGT